MMTVICDVDYRISDNLLVELGQKVANEGPRILTPRVREKMSRRHSIDLASVVNRPGGKSLILQGPSAASVISTSRRISNLLRGGIQLSGAATDIQQGISSPIASPVGRPGATTTTSPKLVNATPSASNVPLPDVKSARKGTGVGVRRFSLPEDTQKRTASEVDLPDIKARHGNLF